MFEAVGESYWPTYFGKLKENLAQSGRAVVQTITVGEAHFDRYRNGADMIRSFIFPGGMLPAPSKFAGAAQAAGAAGGGWFRLRSGLCPHAARLADAVRGAADRGARARV